MSPEPHGLSSADPRRLLREHGANEPHPRPPRSILADLARRFRNPLILILLAASAILVAAYLFLAEIVKRAFYRFAPSR